MTNFDVLLEEKLMRAVADEAGAENFTKAEFAALCNVSTRKIERLVEAGQITPARRRPMEFTLKSLHEYLDYLEGKALGLCW